MPRKKKPTGLDGEELDALQAIVNAKRSNLEAVAQMTIASRNLDKQIQEKIKEVDGNNLALNKLQEALSEKYGDVNINLQTGEFVTENKT